MQEPRGKDVAALGIGTQLNFVHREKIDRPVERHRFDGAHEIGRVRRQDFLFAGDQRDRARTLQLDDAIVILARQKAQRKPDHPALVAEHALDGEVGLAGIGRPEDRDEPRSGAEHAHRLEVSGAGGYNASAKRRKPPRCVAKQRLPAGLAGC